jgi:hypothetical protein
MDFLRESCTFIRKNQRFRQSFRFDYRISLELRDSKLRREGRRRAFDICLLHQNPLLDLERRLLFLSILTLAASVFCCAASRCRLRSCYASPPTRAPSCASAIPFKMVYIKKWAEFQAACTTLYEASPDRVSRSLFFSSALETIN